jgi:hypothetical protein
VAAGTPAPAELPETYTVRTPSGGWHLYFKADQEFACDNLVPGIDAPDYVIVPPSVGYTIVDDRDPVPLPTWVAKRLGVIEDEESPAARPKKAKPARFGAKLPSEDANLPPLVYWDEEQIFPRVPGGCVVIGVGAKTTHKTGVAMKTCLDAIERKDARVLYIAAEGAHGIRTARLPAYREMRNMLWSMLDAHWRTEPSSFDLLNAVDRREMVAAYRAFNPDIVVVDVLTRVVPGADLGSPAVGSAIMVALEELAANFDATVLVLHHPGKDESRGGLGSVLLEALAYAVWKCSAKNSVAKVYVEKMKDGPAHFSIRYEIEWSGKGIPVIGSVMDATTHATGNLGGITEIIDRLPAGDTLSIRELAEQLAAEPGTDRKPDSERKRLSRLIGTDERPGPLAEWVKLDRHGKFLKPYLFCRRGP